MLQVGSTVRVGPNAYANSPDPNDHVMRGQVGVIVSAVDDYAWEVKVGDDWCILSSDELEEEVDYEPADQANSPTELIGDLARRMGATDLWLLRHSFQMLLGYKLPGDAEFGPGRQVPLEGTEMIVVIRFTQANEGPPLERLIFREIEPEMEEPDDLFP